MAAPDHALVLHAVASTDGMTADYYPFAHEFLGRVATRIINEVQGVNRVTYDITSKLLRTIEWPDRSYERIVRDRAAYKSATETYR